MFHYFIYYDTFCIRQITITTNLKNRLSSRVPFRWFLVNSNLHLPMIIKVKTIKRQAETLKKDFNGNATPARGGRLQKLNHFRFWRFIIPSNSIKRNNDFAGAPCTYHNAPHNTRSLCRIFFRIRLHIKHAIFYIN